MSPTINLNYVLGLIDGVIFLFSLFQLLRIYYYSRSGIKNNKPKTIFHFIIAIAMLVRSAFFLAQPSMTHLYLEVIIWYNISTILLFLAYGCLLLFWIELYTRFSKPYISSRDFWRKWRPFIIIFNVLLVSLTVTWIVVLVVWANPNNYLLNIVEQIAEGFVSALFLTAGLGFFIFGILLFFSIKRLGGISSPSLKTSLLGSQSAPPEAIRAAVVGSICTFCFVIRASVMMYSIRIAAVDPDNTTSANFSFGWEFEIAYFFITEILPTLMMLFRMRKVKRRKMNSVDNSNNNNNNNHARYISQSSSGPNSYHAFVYNNSDDEEDGQTSTSSSLSNSPTNNRTSPFDHRDYSNHQYSTN